MNHPYYVVWVVLFSCQFGYDRGNNIGGDYMKKLLMLMLAAGLLAACSNDEPKEETTKPKEKPPAVEEPAKDEPVVESDENEIDTSVYEYASKVDVTDARDVNDHLTLMIDMKTDNQGLAFQHVLNQTYDFLQQPEIEGVKTIGVNVIVDGNKIGMFTVRPEEFKPNDEEPMSDAVLAASEIEMMSKQVEDFGKNMGSW